MLYPKLLTTGVVALLFSIISGTQAFGAPATIQRVNGVDAEAIWPGPVGQFSNIQLLVGKSSVGTDILSLDTPTVQGAVAEIFTTANVFQTTSTLNSATLSPLTLNVCLGYDGFGNCNQVLPVTIQATWTGFGNPSPNTRVDNFGGTGGFHSTLKISGMSRSATSTGTLNGENLGHSSIALIDNFRNMAIVHSR